MRVAAFRPADERLEVAGELLTSLGVEPVLDPMLAVEPTGEQPREDADYTVLTSKTSVEIAADVGWQPDGEVCAIGDATAAALRAAGYPVDHVPAEFSSTGLVAHLENEIGGTRCEVARSTHGSPTLTDGLERAGAYVHETVLYELRRPPKAGESATLAASGDLAGALFTSSLTVENFLAAAAERGVRETTIAGLNGAVVGVIGEPTRKTAEREGIAVDVVPETASFEALARDTIERLSE
jgi:uroporphyrinogen-III synthase